MTADDADLPVLIVDEGVEVPVGECARVPVVRACGAGLPAGHGAGGQAFGQKFWRLALRHGVVGPEAIALPVEARAREAQFAVFAPAHPDGVAVVAEEA